ncbi:NAD dependent epimerase/dehydratase family protein [Legionella birminghamensis]|uniref:NAD dependent epimerase/dehydratase family protein n=1 Tax=Legionella birminghamensis TaxID=28083 RepID=A0A378I802_9GAMM|nr:SDR family NAD(P)-dependent oxidoreductase [Legionella birminghamensis]KTC67933.1 NAD dependent epimerase/dehydratase family protein [Legionella birminghamensis]STX31358.1 NAD dependent epimerase/dehydratase family protein [Legionella birminghamensis]
MRILITGGCGFIGSHIADLLIKKGHEVSVIDDLSSGSMSNIAHLSNHPNFHFSQADILTWPKLQEMVSWSECIYHLAAIIGVFRVITEPLNVMEVNLTATGRLFKAVSESRSKPHVVFASSSSVYGPSPKSSMMEDDDLIVESASNPLRFYAISKLTSEAIAMAYHKTYKLPVTIVRFFNMIGPNQTGRYGMVVPRFIQQACTNNPLTIFGDGTQVRSFCDVRDALSALMLLNFEDKNTFRIVNIGNDREITINELAKMVIKQANSKSDVIYIPYEEAYGMEYHDITRRKPDLSRLRSLTGFKNEWTLEQTIDDLIRLYKPNHTILAL